MSDIIQNMSEIIFFCSRRFYVFLLQQCGPWCARCLNVWLWSYFRNAFAGVLFCMQLAFYSSARLSVCVLLCFGGMYSECVYFCLVAVRNHAYVAQFGKFGGKVYFYAE